MRAGLDWLAAVLESLIGVQLSPVDRNCSPTPVIDEGGQFWDLWFDRRLGSLFRLGVALLNASC